MPVSSHFISCEFFYHCDWHLMTLEIALINSIFQGKRVLQLEAICPREKKTHLGSALALRPGRQRSDTARAARRVLPGRRAQSLSRLSFSFHPCLSSLFFSTARLHQSIFCSPFQKFGLLTLCSFPIPPLVVPLCVSLFPVFLLKTLQI